MYINQDNTASTASHIPWNKDRLTGWSSHWSFARSGQSEFDCKWPDASETLPFSTWRSTASFGAAISLSFKWGMWHIAARRYPGRPSCSNRSHSRWSLSWPTRRARLLRHGLSRRSSPWVSSYSRAGYGYPHIFLRGNTLVLWKSGWLSLG